jgi:hypothetical protein
MGVETVQCPTCNADVRIGLPQGSEIQSVQTEAVRASTDRTKTRPLSCSEGHEFGVQFTVG